MCAENRRTRKNLTPSGTPPPAAGSYSGRDSFCFAVLRLLERDPQTTQRALARQMGVSLGYMNHSIGQLVGMGFLRIERPGGVRNKRGYVYGVTAEGVAYLAALAEPFLRQKRAELAVLQAEIADLAGEHPPEAAGFETAPDPEASGAAGDA